jgi:intracellular septation protein
MSEKPVSPPKVSPKIHKVVRGLVDYGGPLVFLVAYLITRDMIAATWALVAGSAVALAVGFVTERRIAPMPLVAGGAALVFGLLTIIFQDERFVKIKPTVLNLGFAAFLLGGVILKRNPLKALLGEAISLPDHAWRRLTINYGVFFLFVAGLNEFVWRTQPDDVWVLFRMPGLQILALLFSFTQVPLMMKYAQTEAPPPTE